MAKKDKIIVRGTEITVISEKKEDFISLTDMANAKERKWSNLTTLKCRQVYRVYNKCNRNLSEKWEIQLNEKFEKL